MVTIDVTGTEGVIGALLQYGQEAERKVARSIDATAAFAQNVARQEAPVDEGILRNSLRLTPTGVVALLTAYVHTNLDYALRQEFGFQGTDRAGRTYNQAGHFYMTKAAARAEQVLMNTLRQAFATGGSFDLIQPSS